MSRSIDEAIASDNPCSSCATTDHTVYFPIAETRRAAFAYLCARCLAAIADHAFDTNFARNVAVSLATRQLGQELPERRRTRS